MAYGTARARDGHPLPPVSRAHQEGLLSLIDRLGADGQDTTLLTQLAESLPRLRAGLSAADRQRIEELDANQTALMAALNTLNLAVDSFHAAVRVSSVPPAALLVDAAMLRAVAEAAQALAESSGDLALRVSARAGML